MFYVSHSANQLQLQLREDVTGAKKVRSPGSVVIAVPAKAYTTASQNLPGIKSAGWAVPQSQVPGVPWVGWDTSEVGAAVDIKFRQINGPGSIFLFGESTSSLIRLLNNGYQLRSGSVLHQANPSHVHATWLFTKPGAYKMLVSACLAGTNNCSATQTYSWNIQGMQGANQKDGNGVTQSGNTTQLKPAQNQQPKVPGTTVTPGQNMPAGSKPAVENGKLTPIGQNQVDLELNTHVHPNWVFTKPGEYQLTIRMETVDKNGKLIRSDAPLKFNVGNIGNADQGHFDLGLTKTDDGLQTRIKDDRKTPPTWQQPGALTFGLAEKAKTSAPAGLEFLTPKGSEIWMISSAQISEVPWLGVNTQDAELLKVAAGPVRASLIDVKGPGALAVFTQGNFGKVVDKLWFGYGTQTLPTTQTTPAIGAAQGLFNKENILSTNAIAIGVAVIGGLTLGLGLWKRCRA